MSGPAALAIVLALAYCLVLVWLATRQRRIMYVPRTDAIAPGQAGLPAAQASAIHHGRRVDVKAAALRSARRSRGSKASREVARTCLST